MEDDKIREYDEKGNVTHIKYFDGYEEWKEYDEKGNETHYKNSNGYNYWYEYDEKGNMISGYEDLYDYI